MSVLLFPAVWLAQQLPPDLQGCDWEGTAETGPPGSSRVAHQRDATHLQTALIPPRFCFCKMLWRKEETWQIPDIFPLSFPSSLPPLFTLDFKKNRKSSYPLWYFIANTQSFMIFLIVENKPRIKLLHQKEGPSKVEHLVKGRCPDFFGQWWGISECSMMVMFQVLVHHSWSP